MELSELYLELSDYYDHRGEAQSRDRFMVLAADAALRGGDPEEAEHLRQRLLTLNPHHLLKPFKSFEDAQKSRDVSDYVNALRGVIPPIRWPAWLNRPCGRKRAGRPRLSQRIYRCRRRSPPASSRCRDTVLWKSFACALPRNRLRPAFGRDLRRHHPRFRRCRQTPRVSTGPECPKRFAEPAASAVASRTRSRVLGFTLSAAAFADASAIPARLPGPADGADSGLLAMFHSFRRTPGPGYRDRRLLAGEGLPSRRACPGEVPPV